MDSADPGVVENLALLILLPALSVHDGPLRSRYRGLSFPTRLEAFVLLNVERSMNQPNLSELKMQWTYSNISVVDEIEELGR